MQTDLRLSHNEANVIFERFGNEVVAIHLGTGCYYSLPGVAGDAFLLLSGVPTIPELAQALSTKYDAPANLIADDLHGFLRELKAESLIVDDRRVNGHRSNLSIDIAEPRLPYQAPAVYPHRDLENLFLVDPVHDAGEEGWPHKKAEEPESGKPVRYRFASGKCIFERFDEGTVVLNLNTGAYFSFSGPAEDVLLLLSESPTPEEIVKALETKYIASRAQLSQAADQVLTRLSQLELVQPEEIDSEPECRVLTLAKPGTDVAFEATEIDAFRDAPAVIMEGGESEHDTSVLSGKRRFRLKRGENIVAFADDGAVAVHLIRGAYFILNSTAARVLRMLDQTPSPSEIISALERDYEVRRPELIAAVIVLLRNFIGIGLAAAEPAIQTPSIPAVDSPTAGRRIPFEPFAVDMRRELQEQVCLYPGAQPTALEPASRGRQLAGILEEYFDQASSRAPVVETRMLVAKRPLRIRCIGGTHSQHLSSALSHLSQQVGADAAADFTIHVWDGTIAGAPANGLLASYLQSLHRDWTACCGSRGELRGFHSPDVPAFYMPGPDVLNLVDVANRKAFFLKRDSSPLPYWEAGSPFRAILHSWLSAEGLQFIHGGAVGDGNGGVLLAGRGGSGKSTTTLLCVNAGMLYAGDDYCAVDGKAQAYLHSLYNTAKLLPRDLERFPALAPRIWNPEALVENSPDKATFFLADLLPERMSLGFPLKAILIPRVTGQRDTHLSACGPGAALAAMAPSTVAQLPTSGQRDMERMAQIAAKLPTYILHLGSDLTQIPDVVKTVVR